MANWPVSEFEKFTAMIGHLLGQLETGARGFLGLKLREVLRSGRPQLSHFTRRPNPRPGPLGTGGFTDRNAQDDPPEHKERGGGGCLKLEWFILLKTSQDRPVGLGESGRQCNSSPTARWGHSLYCSAYPVNNHIQGTHTLYVTVFNLCTACFVCSPLISFMS